MPDGKLKRAVEAYFTDLRLVRCSGGATDERSLCVPLANLLDAVGASEAGSVRVFRLAHRPLAPARSGDARLVPAAVGA